MSQPYNKNNFKNNGDFMVHDFKSSIRIVFGIFNFLYQFHQETRRRIRELEKFYKQLSKSKNAVAFNKTCLNIYIGKLCKHHNIRC